MKDDLQSLRGFDAYSISLGDELRGERATLGKSLIDVQKDLRLKAVFIAAIEDADLSVFPNQGFIAGYVRSYARYLGMDPDEVFARFCYESGFEGVNASVQPSVKKELSPIVAVGPVSIDDPLNKSKLGKLQSDSFYMSSSVEGLASLAVMAALVMGIGYGAFALLQEVQRVEFAPIAQSPVVIDNSASGFGWAGAPATQPANIKTLEQLYAPEREIAVPALLAPRDGPIGTIDPATVGSFASQEDVTSTQTALAENVAEGDFLPVMQVAEVPEVSLLATDTAWVRISVSDGTAIFEKIMAPGETYILPKGVQEPLLRAGNAGAVYLRVGDVSYGPLGAGQRVVKDVSLAPDEITTRWDRAEGALMPEEMETPSVASAQ